MSTLWLDFETRSNCDLTAAGVYNYAMHRSTEVLCMCYAFDDGDVITWTPDQPFPQDVLRHMDPIYAHNATFERLILWYVLQTDHKLEQFYCTAAQARANCAPGSLEDLGRFSGAGMRKDHAGAALIRKCCVPPFKHTPQDLADLFAYCAQDVRAMRDASQRLRPLSPTELADYHTNERINDRGVLIDVPLARAATQYSAEEANDIQNTVWEVTKGMVPSVRSPVMREWVLDRLTPEQLTLTEVNGKPSIDKSVRANLLACDDLDPDVREVVQSADDIWSSSVAKFARLASLADEEDNRLRGAFVFAGGAATGRACVAATTLVETETGVAPITALAVGERVLTHLGRFCKVSLVVYKGRETMYRIRTKSGGWVDCTLQHMLLTAEGWKSVKELICDSQPGSAGENHSAIYVATVPYDAGSCSNDWADTRYGQRDRTGNRSARPAETSESGELLKIQAGRKEPYVWGSQTGGSHIAAGVSVSLGGGRRRIRAGASVSVDAGNGPDDVAGGLGSSSYRQQQDEQLVRQFGDCDQGWASTVALSEITEIVRLGEKGVWDITVEGDASYCAQGLIHHNSSFGAQVHNLPRKTAKDPVALRQAIVRGHKLDGRVSDALKSMLRPALIAQPGYVFVTADWSAIEGRVNPWLAQSPAGETKLDVYRSGRDPYIVNAVATFGGHYNDLAKQVEWESPEALQMRQVGKVQELALAFGGGQGAFAAMARGYGVTVSNPKQIVAGWRKANPWAPVFWSQLEDAYLSAMRHPGQEFSAGRVTYLFDRRHLWYILPSGRVLCYPFAKLADEGLTYAKASWKPKADATEWPRARLWSGLACIAKNTPVLTERGWIPIQDVPAASRVWDGEGWVSHDGVAHQGLGTVNFTFGVAMTADHKVLTTKGWKRADQTEGCDRAPCRLPYGYTTGRVGRAAVGLGDSVRLRANSDHAVAKLHEIGSRSSPSVVRVQEEGTSVGGAHTPRNGETSGLCGVEVNALPVSASFASSVAKLRRAWNYSVLAVARIFRELLVGHGGYLRARSLLGQSGQSRALRAEKLSMGYLSAAGKKHKEIPHGGQPAGPYVGVRTFGENRHKLYNAAVSDKPGRYGHRVDIVAGQVSEVFDLINCGPRRRFVVQDIFGAPLIVHNCENVVQATAHDLLREALRVLDDVVLHVHDEIVLEVPQYNAEAAARRLEDVMQTAPDWAAGLPLVAKAKTLLRFGK